MEHANTAIIIRLTYVGTDGHLPFSSWYHTTIGPSRAQSASSMRQSDQLGGIPYPVEIISNVLLRNNPSRRVVPLSHCYRPSVLCSTAFSQVSVTSETRAEVFCDVRYWELRVISEISVF